MKKLKKIVGALLALSFVVTQFPVGETVRKLKTEQVKAQNIVTNNMNNNKMMWSENLKKEFSDSLGGGTAKADTETKASITSSKMQFTYAKKGADVQSSLMFCENTIRLNMMEKEQPKDLKV